MLTKIRKVKFEPATKKPVYQVIMECPEGQQLYIKFDYTQATGNFWPLQVIYNKKGYGSKLAWYTQKVEKMPVQEFLGYISAKINRKYDFTFKEPLTK